MILILNYLLMCARVVDLVIVVVVNQQLNYR